MNIALKTLTKEAEAKVYRNNSSCRGMGKKKGFYFYMSVLNTHAMLSICQGTKSSQENKKVYVHQCYLEPETVWV